MASSVVKCFSVLVVAGEGKRCNQLREILSNVMLQRDNSIGISRTWLHKFGREEYPDHHLALRKELAQECNSLYVDIPSKFFGDR